MYFVDNVLYEGAVAVHVYHIRHELHVYQFSTASNCRTMPLKYLYSQGRPYNTKCYSNSLRPEASRQQRRTQGGQHRPDGCIRRIRPHATLLQAIESN